MVTPCFIPNDDPNDNIQDIGSGGHLAGTQDTTIGLGGHLAGTQGTTNLSQFPECSDVYPSDIHLKKNDINVQNKDTLDQAENQRVPATMVP